MTTSIGSDVEEKLGQAFEAFEATLREMLTVEARRSIDGTIERLSHAEGPFRLRGVEVDVVIRGLRVEAVGDEKDRPGGRSPGRRAATKAKSAQAGRRRPPTGTQARGRPPGALRAAILNAFSTGDVGLSTDDLRQHLTAQKVEVKADNLHQQLRRLVKAGELDRTGRATYRRAVPTASESANGG